MAFNEYEPGRAFPGEIGRTTEESTPAWPRPVRATPGSPNVLFVVLDDTGFGHLGCYGSPIATPHLDSLAANGLRYNRMHTTALCSPSRSCVITGRNHHSNGMAAITELATGYPGYNGTIPFENGFLSEMLQEHGYNTYMVGKWHLMPSEQESAAGPYDRWPLSRGFDRFYGFLGGDTSQWYPELIYDNHQVEPPRTPEEGYHLTEDLADHAISFIADAKQVAPDKPFYLHFCTGATHAPHHVAKEWADRYAGRFDAGWDAYREEVFARQKELGVVPADAELSRHDPDVPEWDSLPPQARKLAARMMEVFAGFLTHTDAQIGRLLDFLRKIGELENTLVMVVSDNGASAEGGPDGLINEHRFLANETDDLEAQAALAHEIGGFRAYNHYPWGWAWAGNTPFHLWKRYAWLGGVRTPLVVHWPGHVAASDVVRDQFVHVSDLFPTILESVGVEAPAVVDGVTQQRVDGTSFASSFGDPDAPETRATQYFEMLGSRAIYHDGWKATTDHVSPALHVESVLPGSRTFDDDTWALYDLRGDFAEVHDLAAQEPAKLQSLIDRWWAEAGRNQVLPIDDGVLTRLPVLVPSPWGPRWPAILRPGGAPVAEESLPPLLFGFRVEAAVGVPDGGARGVLAAVGDWSGGWALLLDDGRPVFTLSLHGDPLRLVVDRALAPGEHRIGVTFEPSAPGGGFVLDLDGVEVARGSVDRDLPLRWQVGGAGLSVGRDAGFPVDDSYEPPFAFSGTLTEVRIEVAALAPPDPTGEIELALQHE
jgi:arylsulfatase A-like enzyme